MTMSFILSNQKGFTSPLFLFTQKKTDKKSIEIVSSIQQQRKCMTG